MEPVEPHPSAFDLKTSPEDHTSARDGHARLPVMPYTERQTGRTSNVPPLVTLRRNRPLLIAFGITIFTGTMLLGLIGLVRWGGRQAVQKDTATILEQAGQQLLRTLQSRRGTLTLLRDVLNRQSDLTVSQRESLGASAVKHTRHLLGIGLIRSGHPPVWWSGPFEFSSRELAALHRAIGRSTQQRGVWSVPSTFTTSLPEGRVLLVMLEPLRTPQALIGVFDLAPLLRDFFTAAMPHPFPVQVLDGATVLYRSPNWPSAVASSQALIVTFPVALDAARWTISMQPGSTRVVQTLSWFKGLLIILGIMTAAGALLLVWILTARTWMLQRAVARRTAALRRTSRRLRHMAITDELTGLWNRRFFLDRWERECERARRYGRSLACLMIDVNDFKHVNDRLGHQAGDRVLQRVAQELKAGLRQADVLARYGGDEFVIALPETTIAQAEWVAEKLRRVNLTIDAVTEPSIPPVTISVGVSGFEPGRREHPHEILEAADQALYRWKQRLASTSRHPGLARKPGKETPSPTPHETPSSLT